METSHFSYFTVFIDYLNLFIDPKFNKFSIVPLTVFAGCLQILAFRISGYFKDMLG